MDEPTNRLLYYLLICARNPMAECVLKLLNSDRREESDSFISILMVVGIELVFEGRQCIEKVDKYFYLGVFGTCAPIFRNSEPLSLH